ncbi:hypothetical protein EDB85DRAFT_1335550 [Lactarius pseudohatsudake]|nr:hypothetical protein EDB85DRAFT_1335550 [Lactarius pseudohatsudake]
MFCGGRFVHRGSSQYTSASSMSSHSDHPHTLQSDCATPTRMHLPCENIDSGKITQSHQEERRKIGVQCATTIDTLTDNVLLAIFDLIRISRTSLEVHCYPVWNWHTLVHVCHRWREIIFASPLRLDLQLFCTNGTPVRKHLGCWPSTIPIAISYGCRSVRSLTSDAKDNIVAALEQRDRVRYLKFLVTDAVWEKVATLMQGPFPELRSLAISSEGPHVRALPDDLLGGSAPSLREISFNGIPLPAFPTFLSSASNLVKLILDYIPQTSCISSVALVACLAGFPSLEYLSIGFHTPISLWPTDRVLDPPPGTRVVFPSLTSFSFEGFSTYLEVIMARVDTPQLDSINVTYTDYFCFRATELSKFIERSFIKPSRLAHGRISFEYERISFDLFPKIDPDKPTIAIKISSSEGIHEQVSDMARVLNQTSAMLSDVVHLEITINEDRTSELEDDDMDYIEWLELFRPFTAVKKLRIYEVLAESITRALKDQTEEASTQVSPTLELIYVEDRHARDIEELYGQYGITP